MENVTTCDDLIGGDYATFDQEVIYRVNFLLQNKELTYKS